MDVSIYCDTVSPAAPAKQALGLGFTKFLIRRHLNADQSPSSLLQIDAMARPPVKTRPRKTRLRKRRRTRQRLAGGDEGDGVECFEGGGDDAGGGYAGNFGGGGGGGGRWWNSDGLGGGENWEDEPWGSSGFAADFIYEVLGWIALSNCVHFAFKKLVRTMTDGIGDPERAKVSDGLGSVC